MNTNEEKICRTCLTKSSLFQSIFYDGPDVLNVSFAYMISCSSSVHINLNDGLPDIICFQCAGKILEFYKFKLKIEENDLILKSRLSNVNVSEDKSMQDCEIVIKKECLNDNASFEEIIKYESCEIDDGEDSKSNEPKVDDVPKEGDDHQNNSPAHEFVEYPMDIKEELSNLSFCSKDAEEDIHMKNFCDEQEPSHVNKSKPDDDTNETRHEIKGQKSNDQSLPLKSRTLYDREYKIFINWKLKNGVTLLNETVVLAYFQELGKKYSPSSLWTKFSILKSNLIINDDINISNYNCLVSFLKQKSKGYVPKKSRVLSGDQVLTFMKNAPNDMYLLHKVVLVMGVFGGLKRDEMVKITIDDIQDKNSVLLVNITESVTGKTRGFTIVEEKEMCALKLVRQYLALRPAGLKERRFFLTYRNNRCTCQPVGKNTIGSVPTIIARYLKLDNAKEYTGLCLKRTSSTFLVEAGGTFETLKIYGKCTTIAERYTEEGAASKNHFIHMIASSVGTSSGDLVRNPPPSTPP